MFSQSASAAEIELLRGQHLVLQTVQPCRL